MNYLKGLVLATGFALLGMQSCDSEERVQAHQLMEKGEYAEAVQAYNAYLENNPGDLDAIFNRGRAYAELGQENEALEDYNKVLKADEMNFEANLSVGQLYFRQNDFGQAAYYFEKAAKKKPENANAAFNTGRAYHKSGNTDRAMNYYDISIRLEPGMGKAYMYRGALKIFLENKSGGCADLQKASELGMDDAKNLIGKYCG